MREIHNYIIKNNNWHGIYNGFAIRSPNGPQMSCQEENDDSKTDIVGEFKNQARFELEFAVF